MALLELTADNFTAEVEESSVPVLVDFWAEWCGPCKMIGPILEEMADEVGDGFKIGKVNVDQQRDIAVKYSVQSLPTLLFFKDGEVVDTVVGAATPKSALLEKLKALG